MENELIPLHSPRLKALDAWLKKTNIKLVQINGQRKYGGPPEGWDGPPPGAHCEVFISNISRDAYEDLLIPLFSLVGPLWEFRLMMNFSGQNRGFAYAKYATAELAASAIRLLDGYAVEPGYRLSVRRSTEKRHLCIHNLPASFQPDDVLRALRLLADGVEDVTLKPEDKGDTRAAIVAFSSHHAASMAKKVIVESKSSPVRVLLSDNTRDMEPEPAEAECTETPVERTDWRTQSLDGEHQDQILRPMTFRMQLIKPAELLQGGE
uniref:RRM domain-containing protein n=1 Tax=Salarias fasciatus TaxID=181472 RepID=A0A672FD85_SALFA